MKTQFIHNQQKQLTFLICSSFLFFMMSGCASSQNEIAPTENTAVLNISIAGIEEETSALLSTARTADPSNEITNEQTTNTLTSLRGMDIFTDSKIVQEKNINDTSNTSANRNSGDLRSNVNPKSATTIMPNGVRYRLIMYNQNNVLVVNQVLTAGTNP